MFLRSRADREKHVMTRHTFIPFALAVVAMLGLARPGVASDQVTFSGSLEGSETQTPLPDGFLFGVVTASGEATQLGKYQLTMPHVVNLATRTGVGTFEFVAANGDTLFGTITGQATPTATEGVISIVEHGTITGGTGRFEGATGAFEMNRLHNRLVNRTTGTFEGTVSSPGSSH